MNTAEALLLDIDRFLADQRKMTEKTFGQLAVQNPKIVGRLRAGGTITLESYDRLRAFMASRSEQAEPAPALPGSGGRQGKGAAARAAPRSSA